MPIELIEADTIKKQVRSVIDKENTFLLLTYETNSHNRLKPYSFEEKSTWTDFTEYLKDGRVMYGLIHCKIGTAARVLYVAWCGPGVMGLKRAIFPNFAQQVGESIFSGAYNIKYIARTEEDLSMDQVAKYALGHTPSISEPLCTPRPLKEADELSDSKVIEIHTAEPDTLSLGLEDFKFLKMIRQKVKRIQSNQLKSSGKSSLLPVDKVKEKVVSGLTGAKDEMKKKMELAKQVVEEETRELNKLLSSKERFIGTSSDNTETLSLSAKFSNLSQQQINYAMELFKKHDKNRNGMLSKEEFLAFEKELLSNEVQPELVNKIAIKNFEHITEGKRNAQITKDDFLTFFEDIFGEERSQVAEILKESAPLDVSTNDLKGALELFEKYDLDGNGSLDKEEFYQLKEELNPEMSKLLIRYLVEKQYLKIKGEESGAISKQEFLDNYRTLLTRSVESSPRPESKEKLTTGKEWSEFVQAE